MQLHGIHHVTAVTGHAPQNVTFYTQVLGMRLVKKTVNQDDVSAYHLFYADETGHPGTDLTFFDWPNTIQHRPGSGTISTIGLRVHEAALDWWAERLAAAGIAHEESEQGMRRTLAFTDPEGQRLRLVADDTASSATSWSGSSVPRDRSIRGLGPVTLTVGREEPTAVVLRDVLGFREAGSYSASEDGQPILVFAVGDGGPGAEVHVAVRPELRRGAVGIGGVHHMAFRTPDIAEQQQWRQRVASAGLAVTSLIDRYYFSSIYFREPGGVLFEIATDGPGFTGDEDAAHLGERLSLPPFLEGRRAEIEAGLTPLDTAPAQAGAGPRITSEAPESAP